MKENFNKKRVVITSVIILLIIVGSAFVYFVYSRTIGENEYCRALRKKYDISPVYSCSLGEEYQQGGRTYIYLYTSRPNAVFYDHAIFTMDKKTKEVTSEAWSD